MSNYHPSNKLYRGECNTFQDAIQTLIDAYEYEKALCPDDGEEAQFIGILDDGLLVARRLQAEYLAASQVMELELVKKWRDEEGLAFEIANALVSNDYTGLAI